MAFLFAAVIMFNVIVLVVNLVDNVICDALHRKEAISYR